MEQADPSHQRQRPEDLALSQQAVVQDIVDPPRFLAKVAIALRSLCSGEDADRLFAAQGIGEEVEPLVRIPRVAGDDVGGADRERFRKRTAAGTEDVFEDFAQGEDGWPGIDGGAIDLESPRLAADLRFLLDHGDVAAACGEERGADQPADARSDHDNLVCHLRSPARRLLFT